MKSISKRITVSLTVHIVELNYIFIIIILSNEKIFNTAIKISISKNGRSTRTFKVQFDRRIFLWVNGKPLCRPIVE